MRRGLYIHIPFCASKCHYCDFYSIMDKEQMQNYINACITQMHAHPYKGSAIDTIYIGGGTPSILPLSLLEKLLKSVSLNFSVLSQEVTIEINPCSSQQLDCYKDLGINRLSIGIQSLNDKVLACLGRRHTAAKAISTLERAKLHYGNVSADLMLGVPYQTEQDITHDIDTLADLVTHFSVYLLKTEENTPMHTWINEGKFAGNLADEDRVAEFYLLAAGRLEQLGFARYEISNFARQGYQSIHNLKYWQGKEYLGIGAGAHSYMQGGRYYIQPDINKYIKDVARGKEPNILGEYLTKAELIKERIMLSLRLAKGLDIVAFNNEFAVDFMEIFSDKLKELQDLIYIRDGHISLSSNGFLLQNAVISKLFEVEYLNSIRN